VDGYKAIFCHDMGGSVISVSNIGTVQEWDGSFTEVCRKNLGVEVHSVYVVPSGEYVILPQGKSPILFLKPATFLPCRCLDRLPAVYKLQFSSDGRKALVWGPASGVLALDMEDGTTMFVLGSEGEAVCYSLDGKCIYGSSMDGDLFCLDGETGLPIPASFTSPAIPCGSVYAELKVCSTDGPILL
jgi:outer membrane protein assembly factor BamB